MKPKTTATIILFVILAIITAITLSSCASIPIPIIGENSGKLGKLEIKLAFTPNVSGAIDYLWNKQQPKPTSSK
jgi:hypothetical protein